MNSGCTIGGHYHKNTNEYFYILHGIATLRVHRAGRGGHEEKQVSEGMAFVIYPLEVHTLECSNDFEFMTFLTIPYSMEDPDVYKEEKQ